MTELWIFEEDGANSTQVLIFRKPLELCIQKINRILFKNLEELKNAIKYS